ncbi:hypothetical protein ACFW04_011559 [Cataglyphis niger]
MIFLHKMIILKVKMILHLVPMIIHRAVITLEKTEMKIIHHHTILYVALNPYFEELEIEVVSCPCLTRAPYNLAAAGLSGSTGILRIGTFDNFYPRPRTYKVYNIHDRLSRCNNDFFVIGSGFATQPWMPYNGHLTMNAVVSANSRNVINNSCIAYEVVTNELIMQTINDRNQIKCCLFGQFFFSEGKRGPV